MDEKDQVVSFRCTPQEFEQITKAAESSGLNRADYVRKRALPPDHAAPESGLTNSQWTRIIVEFRRARMSMFGIAARAMDGHFISEATLEAINQEAQEAAEETGSK